MLAPESVPGRGLHSLIHPLLIKEEEHPGNSAVNRCWSFDREKLLTSIRKSGEYHSPSDVLAGSGLVSTVQSRLAMSGMSSSAEVRGL